MKKSYLLKYATCSSHAKPATETGWYRNLVLILFLMMAGKVSGFQLILNGQLKSKTITDLDLYCYAWSDSKKIKPDSSGKFNLREELKYPAEFLLTANSNGQLYRYRFFVFAESQVQAVFDPALKAQEWTLNGLCARCKAWEKSAAVIASAFNSLQDRKPENDIYQELENGINKINGFGLDDYSHMFIDVNKLMLMSRVLNRQGQPKYNIQELDLFKNMLPAREKYAGFMLYRQLMGQCLLQMSQQKVLSQKIRLAQFSPVSFRDYWKSLSDQSKSWPAACRDEAALELLRSYEDPSLTDSISRAQVQHVLDSFIRQHPAHPQIKRLQNSAAFYKQPLLKSIIPNLLLQDRREAEIYLHKFKSRYVVMNVWTCDKPGINACRKLQELAPAYGHDKKIAFIHVCLSKRRDWEKALTTDGLSGQHYLAPARDTDTQLQLLQVPVTYIIAPSGQVLYKGSPYSISRQLLDAVLRGKIH